MAPTPALRKHRFLVFESDRRLSEAALNILSWAFPGSWGNVGFIPRPWPLVQRVGPAPRPLLPRVPAHLCFTLPSPHSFHPNHPLPCCPKPWLPTDRGTACAPRPELQSSAVRSQLCSCLSLCTRGPLCLEHPPTTSPSSKTVPSNKASSDVNSSWKPTQISPCFRPLHFPSLTGPLRSCHSCLASCAFLSLPLALFPPSPCSKRNLLSFTLCCVSWLLFSCLCRVSLSSRPLLMLVLPLQCPSLMTSWQMHSHLSRPSSIVSCEQSLFPTRHPCTSADSVIHCHVPAQPMALFCGGR